jgi:hypothetical protein
MTSVEQMEAHAAAWAADASEAGQNQTAGRPPARKRRRRRRGRTGLGPQAAGGHREGGERRDPHSRHPHPVRSVRGEYIRRVPCGSRGSCSGLRTADGTGRDDAAGAGEKTRRHNHRADKRLAAGPYPSGPVPTARPRGPRPELATRALYGHLGSQWVRTAAAPPFYIWNGPGRSCANTARPPRKRRPLEGQVHARIHLQSSGSCGRRSCEFRNVPPPRVVYRRNSESVPGWTNQRRESADEVSVSKRQAAFCFFFSLEMNQGLRQGIRHFDTPENGDPQYHMAGL